MMTATDVPEIMRPRIDVAICFDGPTFAQMRPVLRHLSVGLIDLISSVTLLCPDPAVEALSLGPVRTLVHPPMHWPLTRRRLAQLASMLGRQQPQVFHAVSGGGLKTATLLANELDAGVVYQVTSTADVAAFERFRSLRTVRVICVSQLLVDRFTSHYPDHANDVGLVRPGVSCRDEPTCFLESQQMPTILCTSRLAEDQGVDKLLDALDKLKQQDYEFLAFFLGTGPMESTLRRKATRQGLGSQVVFAQPDGDVQRAMFGADIFVQPTAETTFSARVAQALAQGMAVVSVAGGINDALVPDQTSIVCASSSVDELATGIRRLLDDHDLARKLAERAMAHMRENHSMNTMAELTARAYEHVITQRESSSTAPAASS